MTLSRRERIINQIILGMFAAFAVVPLIGVLLSSLTPAKENTGGFAIPSHFAFDNYAQAWTRGNFATYLTSSVLVASAVVALTVVLAIFAGFAFARMQFAGSSILFYVLLIGLTLPAEAFIIPLYFNMRTAGLTDSYLALILPQTAQSLAFATFWMRNQFRTFPGEIIEAARLDGARDLKVLWRVMVPASIAPIMTMAVLITMWTWNEFLLPLTFLPSNANQTVPVAISVLQGDRLMDVTTTSASALLGIIPTLLFFLIFQRTLSHGVTAGAVK